MKQLRRAIPDQQTIARLVSKISFRKKSILPKPIKPESSTIESDVLHDFNRDTELLRYIQENDNAFDGFGIK